MNWTTEEWEEYPAPKLPFKETFYHGTVLPTLRGGGGRKKLIGPLCLVKSVKKPEFAFLSTCGSSPCESTCFNYQWRGCPHGHSSTLTIPALRALKAVKFTVIVLHEVSRFTWDAFALTMVPLAWLKDVGAYVRGERCLRA